MSKSYQTELLEALRDPHEAAEYLNAALEDGDEEVFLLALRDVVEAQGGVSQLFEKQKLNKDKYFKILSEKSHSEIGILDSLLHALGFRIAIQRVP